MHCDSKRRQKSLELYGWNGLKSQKFIAQGNGYKQHALKGQKLLAQGSALGIVTVSNAPCKGKSFINFRVSFKAFALTGRQVCEHDNPGRCPGLRASALSGRAACVHNSPGLRASVPSGRAAYMGCLDFRAHCWMPLYPGRCPGLRASAPSIIFALGKIKRWKSLYLQIIVNFAGK